MHDECGQVVFARKYRVGSIWRRLGAGAWSRRWANLQSRCAGRHIFGGNVHVRNGALVGASLHKVHKGLTLYKDSPCCQRHFMIFRPLI